MFQKGVPLKEVSDCCTGMQTGNNEKYIRFWYEVEEQKIDRKERLDKTKKWLKYNAGGESRKWYGNHWKVVNWENEGEAIKHEASSVIRNETFFFKEGITWKRIGSTAFHLRYLPKGFIFDQAGDSMFVKDSRYLYYMLGYVNAKVALAAFEFIAPTLNLTAGNMDNLPIIIANDCVNNVESRVKDCINKAKTDWDSFETSWDFKRHPLI